MAWVYKAVDTQTRKWCALKVLQPELRTNIQARARFAAEARAMAELHHRNIVEVFDVQVDGMEPFFAMELATGGCVVDWLNTYGPMPPRMAVDVAIQVCKALRAAHDKGIIHRDVKPHNILVNKRGVCKLTDFGIARIEESAGMTRHGMAMGTLGYIAPEQREHSGSVDVRADVYSVAATLHAMLTARTTLDLFLADQEAEMMEGVPEALVPLLIRATKYKPDDRTATVADLAKELFQIKGALPEDPPGTPSLVMNDGDEQTDELERFVSSTGGSLPPPTRPADDEFDEPSTTGTGARPALDRDALLRPQHEIERARGVSSANLTNLALGLAPLIALLFTVLILVINTGRVLSAATEERDRVWVESDQILEAERVVVDELGVLGADTREIDGMLAALDRSRGPERTDRMRGLVAELKAVAREAEPAQGDPNVHVARTVEQRIKRLDETSQKRVWCDQRAAARRSGALAGIAVRLGLAD